MSSTETALPHEIAASLALLAMTINEGLRNLVHKRLVPEGRPGTRVLAVCLLRLPDRGQEDERQHDDHRHGDPRHLIGFGPISDEPEDRG